MYYFKTDIQHYKYNYDGSCVWCYKDSIFRGKQLSMPCSDMQFISKDTFDSYFHDVLLKIRLFIESLNEEDFEFYKSAHLLFISHKDFTYLVEEDYICRYSEYPVLKTNSIHINEAKEIINNTLNNLLQWK